MDRIHSLYNYEHVEKANQQLQLEGERKQTQIYRLGFMLFILAGGIVWGLFRYRKQQQTAREQEARLQQLKEEQERNSLSQMEQNRQRIQALEAQLADAERLNAEQKQLLQSERNLLEISNRKIQINIEEKNQLELNLRKSEVYQYFHAERSGSHIGPEKWGKLQQAIETACPQFIKNLRVLYPQISEQELRLCYLIKITVPVKGIATILCKSMSAITNMRTRLYKKLLNEEGKASDFDKFIREL